MLRADSREPNGIIRRMGSGTTMAGLDARSGPKIRRSRGLYRREPEPAPAPADGSIGPSLRLGTVPWAGGSQIRSI